MYIYMHIDMHICTWYKEELVSLYLRLLKWDEKIAENLKIHTYLYCHYYEPGTSISYINKETAINNVAYLKLGMKLDN